MNHNRLGHSNIWMPNPVPYIKYSKVLYAFVL